MARFTRPEPAQIDSLPPHRLRFSLDSWAGWAVAAASVAFGIYDRSNVLPPPRTEPNIPFAETTRDRFRSALSSRLVATAHPLARGAGGTVVWDSNRQEGDFQIVGLAPVDPKSGYYQLWVFDADHDGRYPVGGGMFTTASVSGEAVLPIHPSPSVRGPTFAITLEPPGGVVVSDRERILLTAPWTRKPLR